MMKEIEKCSYTDSIIYLMEQTVVYFKIKAAQIISSLDIGITIDQFAALNAIYSNQDICQRDLSKLILKDRSNTGRILNILEENGFIERIADTKNNRLVRKIYITDKGKQIIEENEKPLRKEIMPVFDDVSAEEFANMRQTLNKLKDSLSKTTSIQI